MPTRFVILQHEAEGGEHWDLMLECENALRTWRLAREPTDRASLPISAKRIFDHRKSFLGFEGPLRGGRGHVRRADAGTVKFEKFTDSECVFDLQGGRLSGSLRLGLSGEDWVLSAAE